MCCCCSFVPPRLGERERGFGETMGLGRTCKDSGGELYQARDVLFPGAVSAPIEGGMD